LTLTNGNQLTGDGTSTLAVFGTTVASAALALENVTLDVRGQLTGPTDITVGSAAGNASGLTLRAATPLYTGTFTLNTFVVNPTGRVTLIPQNDGDTDYTDDAPFVLNASIFTVAAGGVVNADRQGYSQEFGPGAGARGEEGRSGGGGHQVERLMATSTNPLPWAAAAPMQLIHRLVEPAAG
jgi:hypothetical protein